MNHKRVIVKIGTSALSLPNGELDESVFAHIVEQVVVLKRQGLEVIIVTSGAVGAGRAILQIITNGNTIKKQICASVGQIKVMSLYVKHFGKFGIDCGQYLLSSKSLQDKEGRLNTENCLEASLICNIVPIVNENDVMAIEEFVTDNDILAGVVAGMLKVGKIVFLTVTEGVMDRTTGKTISEISAKRKVDFLQHIDNGKTQDGTGGMFSKFNVACNLAEKGLQVYIAPGKRKNVLIDIFNGQNVGTKIVP